MPRYNTCTSAAAGLPVSARISATVAGCDSMSKLGGPHLHTLKIPALFNSTGILSSISFGNVYVQPTATELNLAVHAHLVQNDPMPDPRMSTTAGELTYSGHRFAVCGIVKSSQRSRSIVTLTDSDIAGIFAEHAAAGSVDLAVCYYPAQRMESRPATS